MNQRYTQNSKGVNLMVRNVTRDNNGTAISVSGSEKIQ